MRPVGIGPGEKPVEAMLRGLDRGHREAEAPESRRADGNEQGLRGIHPRGQVRETLSDQFLTGKAPRGHAGDSIAGRGQYQWARECLTMVSDHGTFRGMKQRVEEMAISRFKATCLSVLERVKRTRKAVLITRFGEPVAEVVPPSQPPRPERWIGSMSASGRIVGDIVAPASDEGDWEILRT